MSPDRRPRVTIASRIYQPEPAAASFRLGMLATALADAGAAVTVVTVTAPGPADEAGADLRVRVRRRPVLRDRAGYVRGYVQYLSFDVPLVLRLLLGPRPDVVVAEPPPTTGLVVRLVCALRRVPYVYYAADVWSDAAALAAPAVVVNVLRAVESWVLRGAAHVIAVSDGVAERVEALGAERVGVVPNGIDTRVFTPDGPVDDLGPTAVYAGTMSEWQGADVFVRALPAVLEKLPDALIVFLGHGSARSSLEALARDLGVEGAVRFEGVVPPREAARWLRSARAGLVSIKPGQGYDFAFPTKIWAAVASGTPVLFAGVGAAAEQVEHLDVGRAVRYVDDAVADALVTMLRLAPAEDDRGALARVAEAHASQQRSASRAADLILGCASGTNTRGRA